MPKKGPCILAANHASFLDAILLGSAPRRRVRFIMTELYRDLPLLGWFFRWQRCIFVREDGGMNRAMLRAAMDALAEGSVVAIFPEGGISTDGSLGAIRTGVVSLAVRTRVPVVPAAIHGAFTAMPRDARFPKPATIGVRIGRAIEPGALVPGALSGRAALDAGATRLGCEIQSLLDLESRDIRAGIHPESSLP